MEGTCVQVPTQTAGVQRDLDRDLGQGKSLPKSLFSAGVQRDLGPSKSLPKSLKLRVQMEGTCVQVPQVPQTAGADGRDLRPSPSNWLQFPYDND